MSAPSQQQLQKLITHYNRGELEIAIREANALVSQFPNAIMLYNILGAAHSRLGQGGKALENFSRAVKINPGFPDAHNNLGATLRNMGRPEDAIASYQKAIAIKPAYAEAHYNLGNAYNDLGRHDEAIASFEKAVALKPDYFDAHNNLGLALNSCARHQEASSSLVKAVALHPKNPNALNNLGVALRGLGRQEEAAEKYLQALAINPDHADTQYNLGNALSDLGRTDEASRHYAAALRANPRLAEAYRGLGAIKRYKAGDPQISIMQNLLNDARMAESDKMHLHFALGKASEDQGAYAEAFDNFCRGNALRKKLHGYDRDEDQRLFENIKGTFSAGGPFSAAPEAAQSENALAPIFIVGMPRSGTTLIEQILASHSDVYGAGELLALGQAVQAANWAGTSLNAQQIAAIRGVYLTFLSGLGVKENHITDKAPLNFRWVGFIRHAFPNAKIIHVKREPIAVCWSIFKHYFSSIGNSYAYDMLDVAAYYNHYLDLMDFWGEVYPGDIYEISYEALTENQEVETRKLLSHVGLAWQSETLEFHKTERAVATSSASQVRRKMYKGSSDAWRNYESLLTPMIEELDARSKPQ